MHNVPTIPQHAWIVVVRTTQAGERAGCAAGPLRVVLYGLAGPLHTGAFPMRTCMGAWVHGVMSVPVLVSC